MSKTALGPSRLLRRSLMGNGIFSVTSGVLFVAAAKPIASLLGIDMPILVVGVGISLIVFAVGLFRNAFRENLSQTEALLAIVLDFSWVIGSAVLIALGVLSTSGNWAVAALADVVLVFAVFQTVGLRRFANAG